MRILWVLVIMGLSTAACASYGGYYPVAIAKYGPSPQLDDLKAQIDVIVRDFGFRMETSPNGYGDDATWRCYPELVVPELSRLDGSDSIVLRISVSRRYGRISIYDSNLYETKFVRALKQRIEALLKEHYGIRDPRFKQQRFELFT